MKLKWPQTSTFADVGIIVVAMALVAQVGQAMLTDRPQPASSRAARAPTDITEHRVNDTLPKLSGIDFSAAGRTLLMFVRSTCRFCTESMPFYAKLEAARRASRANLRIIALSHESRDVLGGYLRAHGLAVDAMVSLTQDEYRLLKVRGTPTLILADRSRLIRQVWVGRIRPDAEPSVIAELLEESK